MMQQPMVQVDVNVEPMEQPLMAQPMIELDVNMGSGQLAESQIIEVQSTMSINS